MQSTYPALIHIDDSVSECVVPPTGGETACAQLGVPLVKSHSYGAGGGYATQVSGNAPQPHAGNVA